MAAGTEPVSWLLARSMLVRPVMPAHSPGSEGMVPVKPLPARLLQQPTRRAKVGWCVSQGGSEQGVCRSIEG